jgi:type IV pilus assembly protein PilM
MAAGTPIGLDIGTVSIRAAETSRGKDGLVVRNFGQEMLPRGAVQGGVVHDDKAVTVALKQLWAGTKFRSRHVVLGVTNPQVVVRRMTVANLPQRELRKSLPFQVRDALPLPPDKSLLDFYRLDDPGTAENVDGLLIAAPKEPVLAAVRAVERAGLHVSRVDLASFALLRATSYLDGQVEALVDIGARATSVVVHTDGRPFIVRSVPRGGDEITEMIAARLGATVAEAESLKCRVGLQPEENGEVAELVREALRPLVSELRGSFAYLSTSGQARVRRLALSGGGALLPGLTDLLRSQLDIEVAVVDPAMRLRDARRAKHDGPEHLQSSAAVSIGLTLGAA